MIKGFFSSKSRVKYLVWLLVLVLAFCVISGGCGGSSSHIADVADKDEATYPSASVNRPETLFSISDVSLLLTMDIDDNSMPDFLDFEGVPQFHIDNSGSDTSSVIYTAESILEAAERNIPVPSMIWLHQLRMPSEDANVFSVNLEAGKEYTFEFSRNLTESLGGILPTIKFYDPANSKLSATNAKAMNYEVAAYPSEHPSILCYTVKPAVSGTYIVEVSNGEPTSNEDSDYSDTDSVLFIYEEFRNENNETGYYTNFKFQDKNGNTTGSIGINELIYLRQLFLEANPKFFEEVYGWNLPDDPSGAGGTNGTFSDQILKYINYARFMYRLQAELGIESIGDEDLEDDEDDDEDSDELVLEPITEFDPSYVGKKVSIASHVTVKNNVSASAIEDKWSTIPPHIFGIPYDPQYEIGMGFLATSNFSYIMPQGGITVDITAAWEKATQKYLKKSEDDQFSLQTESYAKFVSTSTQAESLLKATNTLGMSTAAVGMSLGSGTTNNLKFGLTSTNLVIHYEEVENGYRRISAKKIANSWKQEGEEDDDDDDDDKDKKKKKGLFAYVENLGKKYGKEKFPEAFRNNLGDYYVAGYQYGACYDAYISIRTETSEQIKEVEKKLSLALNLGDGDDQLNVSADFGSKLRDTLQEFEAKVNVSIVTNGLGSQKPTVIPLGVDSNDMKALDKVGESLKDFITQVRTNNGNRSKYAPIRVRLSRWRSNISMSNVMEEAGDETGLIPVTVGQRGRIASFNTLLKNLTGYKNVVGDNPAVPSSATADIDPEYNEIIEVVKAGGEKFYASKEDVERYKARLEAITPKYRALADRYAFYTMLVRAQAAEKKIYEKLLAGAKASDTGSEQSRKFVRQMPFGANEGKSSSGYDSFAYSTYVTEDINAGGGELHKQYYKENNSNAFRRFWYETQKDGDDEYLASAGPAILVAKSNDGARAVFCQIRVTSLSRNHETDNLRELTRGSPAVGTNTVGFNFESGRGDHVDWNIYGKAMRMKPEDYPFKGLE